MPDRFHIRTTSSALLAAAFLLAACSSASSVPNVAQATIGASRASVAGIGAHALWREALVHSQLQADGCFTAAYPSLQWRRVACSTPPQRAYPVLSRLRHPIEKAVGNGKDFTANVAPSLISTAVGFFPAVTGVTKIRSVGGSGGVLGNNSYTFQLNSQMFSTAACQRLRHCLGWEQFIYENPPRASGSVFIQDWLIPTSTNFKRCPNKTWIHTSFGCFKDSPTSAPTPNQSIGGLNAMVLAGSAASTGDSVILSTNGTAYGMRVQNDGITDLSQHWQGAEFNVVGNAGGSLAKFNAGSSVTVAIETNTGNLTAPACPANTGTTAEQNNLKFGTAPANPTELQFPSVLFIESTSNGGAPSCDALAGTGT